MSISDQFQVFGLTPSYFTRKVTGALDAKGLPWILRRSGPLPPDLVARGFPGGIPAVQTPQGDLMWDSTAIIEYLDHRVPAPALLPADPVLRFLAYMIDDVSDEWLYRPAVGTRWYVEENTRHTGFALGREVSVQLPLSADQAGVLTAEFVRDSCGRLGVTAQNIHAWIDEILRPWLRVLSRHVEADATPYLLGGCPSLADFAVFGSCAAHFAHDPACRRWMDEDSQALVRHTHRLLEPFEPVGAWLTPGDIPDSLIAVLADAGRFYLPWVAAATRDGQAALTFAGGETVTIAATEFLKDARAVMLGRYRALRSPALDAVLERAGIVRFFADYLDQAGAVPHWDAPPRPRLNRPYPPEHGG